jgi:hypothetical protein
VRAALAAVLLAVAPAVAGEIPGAALVLETLPGTPSADAAAAPPRFVLLEDGQVFVGGDSRVESGRLEKREAQALLKRAEALRRLPGVGPEVALGGPDDRAFRLRLPGRDPLDVRATGDPEAAPPALAPLATLVADLARFHHASLRPYAPASYAMAVREARLVGGCREWTFPFPIAAALAAPRAVSASEAEGWPTGALPASVCADDKRYAVTLRPLLPGESP